MCHFRSWIKAAVILALAVGTAKSEEYQVGESIEVLFLNSWHPGEVLAVNANGLVRAKFKFANSDKIEVFKPDAVRHEYESGAMWRGRLWSDTSGQFKIKAALLKIETDKVLLRTVDKREVSVPLAKLRDADQQFIKKIRAQAGGGSPIAIRPAVERFVATSVQSPPGSKFSSMPGTEREVKSSGFRLAPDPMRATLQLTQAGAPVPETVNGDYLGTVIPLGGNDSWMLTAIENSFSKSREIPMRVLWASLAKSSIKSMQSFPANEVVLDYHAPSKQLLTFSLLGDQGPLSSEPTLSIWSAQPADSEAKGIVSWKARLSDGDRVGHAEPWARFASANIVLQRDQDHRLIAWDITSKRANWSIPQESFFAPQPLLSHNGKYLFVPEDQRLRILDPLTGSELGFVTTKASCSGVALHADGKTLAVLTNNRLLLVDLTGEKPIEDVDATTIANPFSTKVEWVTDDLLAVPAPGGGFVLFSIRHQLPIWTYSFDHSVYRADSRSGRTRTILGGHLAYVAAVSGNNGGYIVGAIRIPEPSVLELAKSVDRKTYMLMGPGARVRTSVEAADSTAIVQAAVAKQLANNQWVYDPNAEFSLSAKIFRGTTQTVQYENFRTGERVSVTSTPIISNYELRRGQDVIWSNASSSGIPPILHLQQGQDVQTVARQWEAPDVQFFDRVDIPHEILNPTKKGGLGVTDVTIRGLVPRKS